MIYGSDMPITLMRGVREYEGEKYINFTSGDYSWNTNRKTPEEEAKYTYFIYEEIKALIEDVRRVGLGKETINKVKEYNVCIVATPVKETIKVVDDSCFILETPNRSLLWAAQTPQAFDFTSILDAYKMFYALPQKDELTITDDAMVYETFLKKPVKILQGEYSNLKITVPEDLRSAEAMIDKLLYEKD
jgi:2-C-methyl-D-erythritol 4-phosphate cytidylyltransferase